MTAPTTNRQTAVLLAALFFLPAWLISQKLVGTVIQKDNKLPLASAVVLLKDTRYGASADSLGWFEIKNFPVGLYVLEARLLGYKTNRYILTADRDETISMLVELELDPILMEAVVVTDSSKTAQLSKLGKTIIRSEEIRRTGTNSVSTFLQMRYPGLLPSRMPPGRSARIYDRLNDRLNFVLYLNGTLVQYSSDVLDTMIEVDQIDYIEVYRGFGMTPSRSRGSNERIIHIHTKIPEFRK
jgi:hypothetical protein